MVFARRAASPGDMPTMLAEVSARRSQGVGALRSGGALTLLPKDGDVGGRVVLRVRDHHSRILSAYVRDPSPLPRLSYVGGPTAENYA